MTSPSRWALPAASVGEMQRRVVAEDRRALLVRLGLLVDGVRVRRRLSEDDIESARLVGVDLDADGRER